MKRLLNKLLGRVYYIEEFPWPFEMKPINWKYHYMENGKLKNLSKQLNISIVTATQRKQP